MSEIIGHPSTSLRAGPVPSPRALHFTELEETPKQRVETFFTEVISVVTVAMYGDQPSYIVSVGYNSSGMKMNVSVPPDLRGSIPEQTVQYHGKAQGRDSTVTVSFVHED